MAYEYTKKTWVDGEVITDDDLNRMETGITEALREASLSKNSVEKAVSAAEAAEKAVGDHSKNKENPHGVTAVQIGAAPSTHNHPASNITEGTLAGKVVANASAVTSYSTKQVRNIVMGQSTSGVSLANGDILHVYE